MNFLYLIRANNLSGEVDYRSGFKKIKYFVINLSCT